jgi:hypothetical protein
MSHHPQEHSGHHHHEHQAPRRGLHKDWRAWVVVGLMLAAMAAYVMTNDEADQPGGEGPPVPAAAE